MRIKKHRFKCVNLFFVYFKKHYCPYCGEKLICKKVHSDSEEAKNNDVKVVDKTHIEFYCSSCQKQYSMEETKENDFLIDRWK